MSDSSTNGKSWIEWLRLGTPFMTLVLLFYASSVKSEISEIRQQMFHHLTNADLHVPKSIIVTKAEFDIYQMMRTREMGEIKDSLCTIERLLLERKLKK